MIEIQLGQTVLEVKRERDRERQRKRRDRETERAKFEILIRCLTGEAGHEIAEIEN